jgi:hypothetical protein
MEEKKRRTQRAGELRFKSKKPSPIQPFFYVKFILKKQ